MSVIDDLKRDEGFRAKPYRDSEGLLTIGYGTLIEDGITEEEAGILLGHRADRIWSEGSKPASMSRRQSRLAGAPNALDSKWARQVGRRADQGGLRNWKSGVARDDRRGCMTWLGCAPNRAT